MTSNSAEPIQAYPLQWPPGWRRKTAQQRTSGRFRDGNGAYKGESWRSASRVEVWPAIQRILRELSLMGIPRDDIVISTNIPTRLEATLARRPIRARLCIGVEAKQRSAWRSTDMTVVPTTSRPSQQRWKLCGRLSATAGRKSSTEHLRALSLYPRPSSRSRSSASRRMQHATRSSAHTHASQ